MRVSFRAHLASGVLTGISLIFTSVALFTCHWLGITASIISIPIGLFKQGGACAWLTSEPGWSTCTLVFMIIAFIAQCLLILHVITSLFCRRYSEHVLKVDSFLISLATICLLIAVIVYVIGACIYMNNRNVNFSFDYSFILAWIAFGLSCLAGIPVGHAYRRIHYHGDCECEGVYY